MIGILKLAKEQLNSAVHPEGVYIDFTMGNGHDTLYLSQLVPKGKVYAFDIQSQALEKTKELLNKNDVSNVTLVHDSHEEFSQYYDGEISGGLFNLGFLPGGDHSLTTRCEVTLRTLSKALDKLRIGGVIAVVIYPGHEEGAREGIEIGSFLKDLPRYHFDCFMGRLINISDCPYVYVIERKRS